MKKNLIVAFVVVLSIMSVGMVANAAGFRNGRGRAMEEHGSRGNFRNDFQARREWGRSFDRGDTGCHSTPTSTVTTYTIVASVKGGTISPSGTVTIPADGSQTFTATANPGFQNDGIIVDGVSIDEGVGTTQSYTFTGINADHTIEADFVPLPID